MPYKDPLKQKEYQRNWYQKKTDFRRRQVEKNRIDRRERRRVVNARKLERGCTRCGYDRCAQAIDAHHGSVKNFGISRAIQDCKPVAEILAELELCELVCANCHREEHATPNI